MGAGYMAIPVERLEDARFRVEDWKTRDGISLGIKVRFEGEVPSEIASRIGKSDTLHIPV